MSALAPTAPPRSRRQTSAPATVVDIPLHDKQWRFVFDQHRYTAFVGGRGSGKTFAGSVKGVLKAQAVGGLGAIGAPSFPQLEDGAKKQFIARLDEAGIGYSFVPSRNKLYIPGFNAEISFVTLENASRVRSPNFSWAWADEIDYLTDLEIWRALKGAVRVGEFQLFVTSTPKGRRLIYTEWVVKKDRNHKLYRATTLENPFIDSADYAAGLGYEGRYYEQEILATFVGFEGLVYPAFTRERQVAARTTDGWRRVLGVDIGTRNPTAIIEVAAFDTHRHVASELYRTGMSSREIVRAIEDRADLLNPEAIYLDPSAAAYLEDLTNDGYPAYPAENALAYGIGQMTTAIADGMTVDPACVNVVAELESYAYPENRKETDKPVKAMDHAMDATRYALVGLAGPPTQTTQVPNDVQEWMEAWTSGE